MYNEFICLLKYFGEILLRVFEREVLGDVNIYILFYYMILIMYRGFNNIKYF